MRVCVDTNVLISYLLDPTSAGPPARTVRACFQAGVELVLNETILKELTRKISSKSYLQARIGQVDADEFVSLVREVATIVPEITEAIPSTTRDTNDDYLIAHSIMERVDYLVSGDKDLLALGSVLNVRIVSPADFVLLLRTLDD